MNRLIVIGASGHGRVIADIAKLIGYREIVFLDDDESIHQCAVYPVLGNSAMASELKGDLFIAVGNPAVRKKLMELHTGRTFPVLIHPRATVAGDVQIAEGTVVMAGAVINPGAIVGRSCIINTASSVDHDCVLQDYIHVSVGAHLAGTVSVGEGTWVGAGAVISNNLSICAGCMIGAGAVVVRDIVNPGTYIGVPARMRI